MDYQSIIGKLESNDYHEVKKSIYSLITDDNFIKNIVRVRNPIVFDRFIKMCEFKIDTSIIYEERNKFVRREIFKLNKDNIYEYFGINNLEESRKEIIANRYLTEYIVNYYFQDNFYNLLCNFRQMTKYLSITNKKLVNEDHLRIYQQFIDLIHYSIPKKIKFFESHLKDDLMSMFYDDITIVREDSHKSLVDKSLKLNKSNGIYQDKLSKKNGVPIYYLNGEEFFGFVRRVSLKHDEKENDDYIYSRKNRLGYNFAYASSYDIGIIENDSESVLLYYDDIDYRNIMYVHHTDMASGIMIKQNDYVSHKENEIVTPNELASHTINYSDVYIKPGSNGIMPSALICCDVLTEEDIAFAKSYNLSILLVNTKKYKRVKSFRDDLDSCSYVI